LCFLSHETILTLFSNRYLNLLLGNEEVSSSGTESNSERQTANSRHSLLVDPVLMVGSTNPPTQQAQSITVKEVIQCHDRVMEGRDRMQAERNGECFHQILPYLVLRRRHRGTLCLQEPLKLQSKRFG
jgi:hypothetical protein